MTTVYRCLFAFIFGIGLVSGTFLFVSERWAAVTFMMTGGNVVHSRPSYRSRNWGSTRSWGSMPNDAQAGWILLTRATSFGVSFSFWLNCRFS